MIALETKVENGTLNFGWRYNGGARWIVEKDGCEGREGVRLNVCGGETELLYLFKVFSLIDDYALYWEDKEVNHSADFIYASLLVPFVEFSRFTKFDTLGVDYHQYMGVRDSQGLNILDYDIARAAQFEARPLLARIIRSNLGREIIEGPAREPKAVE